MWADQHIEKLIHGETVQFRPVGNSMAGIVESRQLVTVAPINGELKTGDVVLTRVAGSQYLHLVKAVGRDRVLIGNNRGHVNGWTPRNKVYGIMTKVEP